MGGVYCKCLDMYKAVNLKKPGINKKARAVWTLKNAKEKGVGYYDPSSERQSESRATVRQAM